MTEDQQQFGPVPRPELDRWLAEGRITALCQLLREGASAWQWAPEVYPSLAQPAAPAVPFAIETGNPYAAPSAIAPRSKPTTRARKSAEVEFVAYSCFAVVGACAIRFILDLVMVASSMPQGRGGEAAAALAIGATCGTIILVVLMIPYVVAGIGVSGRKQWGRIMNLILAGFSALFGLLGIAVVGLQLLRMSQLPPWFPQEVTTRLYVAVAFVALITLTLLAHAVGSFAILTQSKYAKEFR